MAKNLQMMFATTAGTKTSMTIGDVKQTLEADAVRSAMESMVASGVFATSKGEAYTVVVGAAYVETIETELFTNDTPAA